MAAPRVTRNRLSPTAHLLRNSRLFSLPTPLPRPAVGTTTGAGTTKASASATLPYPTHQAITTTRSSLARGDWGLKRNLPARSHVLQTSDPVLRISQLDTIEDVTDFDSAADHVRTRQKWQQMSVPMMRHATSTDVTGPRPPSAFEARDDTTSYRRDGLDESGLFLRALQQNKRARERRERTAGAPQPFTPFQPPPVSGAVHNARRWKHDGPWLPGQTESDFTAYLAREIARRRADFNEHLVEFVKNEIYTARQLAAARAGDLPPVDDADARAWQAAREQTWAAITPDQIAAGIRALRRETALDPLRSRLVTKLITPFLHLPPVRDKPKSYKAGRAPRNDHETFQIDAERAPTSTHPSAGLGYLRSRAYLASHPILGPQASPAPVAARVLQPRATAFNRESHARLGVGGFVALDHYSGADATNKPNSARFEARDVETIDLNTPGGRKIHVNPQFGAVTNDGRVELRILRADGAEVAVQRGWLEDLPPVSAETYKALDLSKSGARFATSGKTSGVKALDAAQALSEASAQGRQLEEFLARTAQKEG